MIRWNNDQERIAHTVATAILRMIAYDQIKTKAVAALLDVSEEKVSHILTDIPPALSSKKLRDLFRSFNLSPLFLLTEQGETHFENKTPAGRMLEALNVVIANGQIESIPQYFRWLGISNERETSSYARDTWE